MKWFSLKQSSFTCMRTEVVFWRSVIRGVSVSVSVFALGLAQSRIQQSRLPIQRALLVSKTFSQSFTYIFDLTVTCRTWLLSRSTQSQRLHHKHLSQAICLPRSRMKNTNISPSSARSSHMESIALTALEPALCQYPFHRNIDTLCPDQTVP